MDPLMFVFIFAAVSPAYWLGYLMGRIADSE
jgi:hypothetical protein